MSDTVRAVQLIPELTLESGAVLRDVRQAYRLHGRLNAARDNLVLVFHALTGSTEAADDWWRGVVGPGCALDTDQYAVLVPNLLGSCYGTTGPASDPSRSFPAITTRDQARLAGLLVDALCVESVALVTGGSLGGMVALEYLLLHPGRARAGAVLAAPAAHTAYAIGWNQVQREAIRLGGPGAGLALARKVGMLTYRTEEELEQRFGRRVRDDGRFEVESYLERQGEKLLARFDAETYLTLLGAMDSHDVGRGRGGVEAALAALHTPLVAAGVPGDVLYGAETVRRWAAAAGAAYRTIESPYGHDAFLLEVEQVGRILAEALSLADAPAECAA